MLIMDSVLSKSKNMYSSHCIIQSFISSFHVLSKQNSSSGLPNAIGILVFALASDFGCEARGWLPF